MEFKTFVFYFLSAILVFAGLRVITARNPVHAALYLVLAFFSASGVWMLWRRCWSWILMSARAASGSKTASHLLRARTMGLN